MDITPNLFQSYCYGPADLVGVTKGSSTMRLRLRDSAGTVSQAVYRGCVYWRLGEGEIGIHLSLVQRMHAEELLRDPDSVTVTELHKNADDVPALLREWEAAGLSFYLHLGKEPGQEFLVVARSLDLHD